MGRSIVYCSICGCPFQDISCEPIEGTFDQGTLLANQTKVSGAPSTGFEEWLIFQWLARFRVIGNADFERKQDDGYGPFTISSHAIDAQFRSVHVEHKHPDNMGWGNFNSSLESRKWTVLQKNRSGIVIYPLHDACLAIMQHVSHSHATRGNTRYGTLEGYYSAMLRLHEHNTVYPYDTPLEEEVSRYTAYPGEYGSYKLEWEHQYYGAARFANGSSWCIEPGWEWLCADPLSIPGLTSYVLSHLQPFISRDPCDTTKPRMVGLSPSQTATTLEALPTEIINDIVSFLPTIPALRLRRCSRSLYAKMCLDQKFWLDHLVSGDLVDYLWDLDMEEIYHKHRMGNWNWKQLAQLLFDAELIESALAKSIHGELDEFTTSFEKASLHKIRFRDAPIGLQNRCRIIKIVKDIEKIEKTEAKA